MVSEDTVLETIKENIIDPEIGINIVDMGLIYGVDINDTTVDITMTLTSPGCPAGGQIVNGAPNTSHSRWTVLMKSTSMSSGIRVGHLK